MFADRLNELIEKKSITRYQVAKATGVTEATLSNYTKGKGNPNTSIVKQLADYFEVSFEWLMYGDGEDERHQGPLLEGEPTFHPEYPAKKQRVTSSDITVLVQFFEKQLAEKDALIKHLLTLLDENLLALRENANNKKRN